MDNIRRALVALDLSKMDDQLLSYTRQLTNLLDLKKIYFVHVIPDLVHPKNPNLDFHHSFSTQQPIDEKVRSIIEEKIETLFDKQDDLELVVEVVEGSPAKKIVHWTKVKEVDLLITGKKKKSEGSGITPRRIAHQAECSVLLVSENSDTQLKKIGVPIDFSDHSARAMKTALQFKTILPEVGIYPIHVLRLLPTDYYFGLDQNPVYTEAFTEETKKAYEKFIDQFDLPRDMVQPVYLDDNYNNVSRALTHHVEKEDYDLVIMGAQGHTAFENFLYGSVTERFVDYLEEGSILVVR